MFTSPLETSEMRPPMQEYMSYCMEEKMAKTTVANSGYKMTKRITLRKEGQTFLVLKQQKC